MLKPLYQGKLDAFCAVYAVLNALRLTHSIRSGKARDILNDTLLGLSANREEFRKFLTQQTDYMDLVDEMLDLQQKKMPLEVKKPFSADTSLDELWQGCEEWLGDREDGNKGRAIIFRFMRYLNPQNPPANRHWTTASHINPEVVHLFDCSHEAEAILNIKKANVAVAEKDVDKDHLVLIQPESVRFLRLPF